MALVSFSSAKGGVGKTTLAVNLAAEFAQLGTSVIVLDCDQNQHATQFGDMFCAANPKIPLRFQGGVDESNILPYTAQAVEEAEMVIVDLPAGSSKLSMMTMMRSDLVVIPSQRTSLDAKDAARTAIQIMNCESLSRHSIASVLIWTMVGAQFETRTERSVRQGLTGMVTDPARAFLAAPLMKLDAYPAGFVHGFVPRQVGALAGKTAVLPAAKGAGRSIHVPPSAAKAAENIEAIAQGIMQRLVDIRDGRDPGRFAVRPEVVKQMQLTERERSAA